MEVEAGIYQETAAGKTQLPILDRLWRAQCRPWAYDFELDREEEAAIARDFRNSRCPEF